MAVPTVVGASTTAGWVGGGGSGATLTANMPTVQTGDLLILIVFVRAGGRVIDLTSGYTLLSGDNDNPAGFITSEIQAKIAGPGETAPSVHTNVTDTQPTGAVVVAVRGWSGDLTDLTISTVASGANNLPMAPDLTPAVDDTLALRVYLQHDDNTISSPPAGHTQVFAELTVQGSDANMAVFARDAPGVAGVGVGTAAPTTSGSDPWSAYTLLIPPASDTTVDGAVSAVLPTITATGSGVAVVDGSVGVEMPPLDVAVLGVPETAGAAISAVLPRPTVAATGTQVAAGTVTAPLPNLTAAYGGEPATAGVVDAPLPAVVTSHAGTQVTSGTLTGSLPPLVVEVAEQTALAGTLPAMTAVFAAGIEGGPPVSSLLYPDTGSRYVLLLSGRPAVNATAYLYEDEDLTVPAEVYDDDSGTRGDLIEPDADGRTAIRLDAFGRQPDYWGPSSGADTLWIVINGVVSRVNADYNQRISDIPANLGDAATRDVGTASGTVAAGDDSRILGAVQKSANLADLTSAAQARTNLGLGNVDDTSDLTKPLSTATQTALGGKVGKGDIFINVKDWPGIAYNGTTDDSVAFRQLLASIPAAAGNEIGGICLWFPRGVMLLNTPDGDGWLAAIRGKANVTLMGAGNGARIRTSSANAEGMLLVEDCTLFTMENILLQVIGTARVKYGVHYTVSSPGSAHEGRFVNVKASCNGSYRKVYDFATTATSTTVLSAQAAFSSGDVGGVLMLNLPSGPHFAAITAANTVSATLAADVTTTAQTTLTLTAPLPGAPASGFTVKVGTERMFVSAGGNTTTLTVARGRGPDLIRTTHSTGATVVTYSATLADAVPDTVTNAAVLGRIQPAGSAVMQHGITIAATPTGVGNLDVANTVLDKVSINRAAVAGIRVGNGTAANVLDQYAYGLSTAECAIGVHTHGGSLSVYGGQCSVNLIDFRRQVAPSSPVVIDGLRSEDAGMFYEMTGQATAGPSTTIRNVEVALMHAEDGVAIRHLHSGALHLENVSIKASDVAAGSVSVVASGTSSFPCHLTVINFSTSGGNLDPFATSVAPATIKTILNAPRMLVPSRQVFANTVLGSYFGNRVQLAAGLVRGRTTVADASYTVLQTDTVIAYTSLTAARVVTLPAQGASLLAGQEFTIKDESGACDGTKTITISPPAGTIDGAANIVLNSAYAKVSVYTNGTNWYTR